MSKIVAIDYDGTISLDPETFSNVIKAFQMGGFSCFVLTMRFKNEPIKITNSFPDIPVIYTGRKAKKPFVEALGIKPDIYIDDVPYFLLLDAYQPMDHSVGNLWDEPEYEEFRTSWEDIEIYSELFKFV